MWCDRGAVTRLIGVLGTGHGRLAVERGMALLVGGMFCDEVAAAVDDTRRGPIMLMRSCGFPPCHRVVGAGGHVQGMLV